MNHLNFYKYASLGLLILNIAMVAFFLLTKPKPPSHRLGEHAGQHPGPDQRNSFEEKVIGILELNEDQQQNFQEYAQMHNGKLSSIAEQQEGLLLDYFDSVNNATNNTDTEIALTKFQQYDREKLEVTRDHLMELKNLLKEDQLPNFKEFMEIFTERIIRKQKKKPPPPKDFK